MGQLHRSVSTLTGRHSPTQRLYVLPVPPGAVSALAGQAASGGSHP